MSDNKKLIDYLIDSYIFIIFLIFPFLVDSTGYYHIFEVKWNSFKNISIVFMILFVIFSFYYLIVKKINIFKNIKFKLFHLFLLIYILICIISMFFSPFNSFVDLFYGAGRGNGLFINLLYFFIFLIITLFGKFKKKYILFFTFSSFIFSLIAFFQYIGIDFLNMYQDGMGTHNVSFIGTIGNIDFVSTYYIIVLSTLISSFIINNKNKYLFIFEIITILLSTFIFEIINVDSGKLTFLFLLVIFLPFFISDNIRISKLLVVLGILFLGYAINIIINPVYHYNINKLTLDFQFNKYALILLVLSLGLFFIGYIYSRLKIRINNKLFKKYYYIVLSIGIIFLILFFYFVDIDIKYFHQIHEILHFNFDDNFGTYRLFLWKRSICLIKDYPYLGTGLDSFVIRFMNNYSSDILNVGAFSINDSAANIYLTMLVNVGFIGFIFYMLFIISFIKNFKNCDNYSLCFLISIIGYLFQGLFNLEIVVVTPLFWVLLACSFLCLQRNNNIL